jgi:hypothetical protein
MEELMRWLVVLTLCLNAAAAAASQQNSPTSARQDPFRDGGRRDQLLTVEVIDAGEIDGGSTVLRDRSGRALTLAARVAPRVFHNVPLRQFLESLGAQAGLSIQLSADVPSTTTLTVTITRPTPTAEVFTVVLSAARLQATVLSDKVLGVSAKRGSTAK